jgi:hypothetical protein
MVVDGLQNLDDEDLEHEPAVLNTISVGATHSSLS